MRTPLSAPATRIKRRRKMPVLPIRFCREVISRLSEAWRHRIDHRDGLGLPIHAPVSRSDCFGRQAALSDKPRIDQQLSNGPICHRPGGQNQRSGFHPSRPPESYPFELSGHAHERRYHRCRTATTPPLAVLPVMMPTAACRAFRDGDRATNRTSGGTRHRNVQRWDSPLL